MNDLIVVFNPTEAPVVDYPIQDPHSKEVKMWSILPGQTLKFPAHAGNYLLETYGFLQRVMTEEEHQRELAAKKKIQQGQQFTQVKIVPAVGAPAAPVSTRAAGFTTEAMKGKTNIPTPNTPQVIPTPPRPAPLSEPVVPHRPMPTMAPAEALNPNLTSAPAPNPEMGAIDGDALPPAQPALGAEAPPANPPANRSATQAAIQQ